MKRIISILLIIVTIILMIPANALTFKADAAASKVIVMRLDNPEAYIYRYKITIDDEGTCPFIMENKTYVPTRFLNERMAASVYYTSPDKPIYSNYYNKEISYKVNDSTVYLNFEYNGSYEYQLEAPIRMIDGKVYIPIRDIAEIFGYTVQYFDKTKVIVVSDEPLTAEETQSHLEYSQDLIADRIPVSSVSVNKQEFIGNVGDTFQLEKIIQPENASNKKTLYLSSNTSVATVTSFGVVSIVGSGSADITVKTGNNKVAVCKVSSKTYMTSFKTQDLIQVAKGGTNTIKVTLTPSYAINDLTWSTSSSSIATVDANGVVKGVTNGTCVVTAKSKSKPSLTYNCVVDVTSDSSKKMIVVYKGSQTIAMYQGEKQMRLGHCSTGRTTAETPTGKFKVQFRSNWYYFSTAKCWIKYGIGFYGNYVIHTVPYSAQSSSTMSISGYNSLGSKASAGCVRTAVKDTKFLKDNSYVGMEVYVTNYSGPKADPLPKATKYSNGRGWDPTDPDSLSPYNK